MKDMSKFFFNINGYSIKSLRSIDYDTPVNEFEQSEDDIYGEFDNIYAPSKKITFTLVVPAGDIDEFTLDAIRVGKIESVGTYMDKRGKVANTISFNKALIQKKTKPINRTDDTVQYTIIASRTSDTTIKA